MIQVVAHHSNIADLTGKTNASHDKKEKQMLTSVILIVAIFTVCNSFESILFILAHQGFLSSLDIFWDYLRPTANFLMVLNSSVNSLIFGICNTTFRNKFVEIFLCRSMEKSEYYTGIDLQSKMTHATSTAINRTPINSRKTTHPSGQQETAF